MKQIPSCMRVDIAQFFALAESIVLISGVPIRMLTRDM